MANKRMVFMEEEEEAVFPLEEEAVFPLEEEAVFPEGEEEE